MSYKPRCTRDLDGIEGRYTLSYGRGKRKITGVLQKTAAGWEIEGAEDHHGPFKLKRDAVEAWGEWAAGEYESADKPAPPPPSPVETAKPKRSGPPSLPPKRGGPPPFKRSSAPASKENRPAHPEYQAEKYTDVTEGDENPYLADPFNPAFFERPDNNFKLTALGALDEVFNWMQENLAFTATVEYPWVRVTKILQREFPSEAKYKDTGA